MKKIELLAPAGDLEKLKIAVLYGADAVYIGGKHFSLRSRASNFSLEQIKEGVEFAHKHNVKVHVTINMIAHDEDMEGFEDYVSELDKYGVDAFICASAGMAMKCKQLIKNKEVHMSTQHSTTNSSSVTFWQNQGIDRVVLARECSMKEIKRIVDNTTLPLEVFIHGGMCISYSGRCVLSNYMTQRDANRGGCAQSCRWKYELFDQHHQYHNSEDMFSMSSKDLVGIRNIANLISVGITSLKIEGRMKSAYYIATLIKNYRMLIDELYASNLILCNERYEYYEKEIAKAENRPTATGFLNGAPQALDHLYGINGAGVSQEYIAYVLDYDKIDKVVTLQVRNYFEANELVEVFSPHDASKELVLRKMWDENHEVVIVANKPMQIIYASVDQAIEKDSMIRKVNIRNIQNVY